MKILNFTFLSILFLLSNAPLLCENDVQSQGKPTVLDESNNTNENIDKTLTQSLTEWNEKPSAIASISHWGIKLIPTYIGLYTLILANSDAFKMGARIEAQQVIPNQDESPLLANVAVEATVLNASLIYQIIGTSLLMTPACTHLLIKAYEKICSAIGTVIPSSYKKKRAFLSQLNTAIANNCFTQLLISGALLNLFKPTTS